MSEPTTDTQVQQAIDALLYGASLEALARQFELTPEEWEHVMVAHQFSEIQVAERSQIRTELKEHLMETLTAAEQERYDALERASKPEEGRSDRRRRFGRILLIALGGLVGLGVLGLVVAVLGGALFLGPLTRVDALVAPNQPQIVEGPGALPPFSTDAADVYLVQQTPDVVFGEVFALRDMFVRTQEYSPMGSLILMWELQQPLQNAQYTVQVDIVDAYGVTTIRSVDIGFPAQAGTIIATEHDINFSQQNTSFNVTVVDRLTGGEALPLSTGGSTLTLTVQPQVTIPSVLVPGESSTAPTVPPMLTATPLLPTAEPQR